LKRLSHLILKILIIFALNSCTKERSCESCRALGWEFVANGVKYEGEFSTAVLNDNNCGFTVYGPSKTNQNNILTLAAHFYPIQLTSSFSNVSSDSSGFIYTEKIIGGVSTVFATGISCCYTMIKVITNYDNSSKMIEGSFSGFAYDLNGDTVEITNGRFKAML